MMFLRFVDNSLPAALMIMDRPVHTALQVQDAVKNLLIQKELKIILMFITVTWENRRILSTVQQFVKQE